MTPFRVQLCVCMLLERSGKIPLKLKKRLISFFFFLLYTILCVYYYYFMQNMTTCSQAWRHVAISCSSGGFRYA